MRLYQKYQSLFILFTLSCLFHACNVDDTFVRFVDIDTSISDYVASNADCSYFLEAIEIVGISPILDAYNPESETGYTLFLPNNAAFETYFTSPDAEYKSKAALFANIDFLKQLVNSHIVLSAYTTNNFPYGALDHVNANKAFLTIYPDIRKDSTVYVINENASVIEQNIELTNGYVHLIDHLLLPYNQTAYEYISVSPVCTIFKAGIDSCGLDDFLKQEFQNNPTVLSNAFSLMIEPDSVFNMKGIYDVEGLKTFLNDSLPSKNTNSKLYQFMAYHIAEKQFYLNKIETQNIPTKALYPFIIYVGLDITINNGYSVNDTSIIEGDPNYKDLISIIYEKSNISTSNAVIHFIDNLLEVFQPPLATQYVDGENDPKIMLDMMFTVNYIYSDTTAFQKISWRVDGDEIEYRSNSRLDVLNYFNLDGNFRFRLISNKIYPGKYKLNLIANQSSSPTNAIVRVAFDGKFYGKQIDLSINGPRSIGKNSENPRKQEVGIVEVNEYTSHEFVIETIKPGKMSFYYFDLVPIN